MRAVIRYSRESAAKWASHLDMQRAFSRALRRADIPVMYSQGFNPHILMSFASPLSVGFATKSDYLEIRVRPEISADAITSKMNEVLPNDIRVVETFFIDDNLKKLMALNHSASYEINLNFENIAICDIMRQKLVQIISSNEFIITDRKGRQKDIRAMIIDAEISDGSLKCTLANSSSLSLNPASLTAAITDKDNHTDEPEFVRTECYASVNGKVIPFYKLKSDPAKK